jgi:hypothetical protein
MKKFLIYLILTFAVIINIYLIFCWQPQGKGIIKDPVSKETISYSRSLYKIDKEKALDQLSAEDKKELEKILKKLSTFDMGKIKEYYEDSNEEEGIISIFKLLKKRLITEDYKRIEEITSSFLDIGGINEEIKKNKIIKLNKSIL